MAEHKEPNQGPQAEQEAHRGGGGGEGKGSQERSSEQLQEEMHTLREDLRKVQGDLQQIAESAVSWGRESYEQARDVASHRMETGMDQVEQYVRQRPITMVLTAFGIGLLMGAIFRR